MFDFVPDSGLTDLGCSAFVFDLLWSHGPRRHSILFFGAPVVTTEVRYRHSLRRSGPTRRRSQLFAWIPIDVNHHQRLHSAITSGRLRDGLSRDLKERDKSWTGMRSRSANGRLQESCRARMAWLLMPPWKLHPPTAQSVTQSPEIY